jgi:predicted AAA+ superfamily ATPase
MLRTKYADAMLKWSQAAKAKPLLLWGARQVGKTTLMKQFAEKQFRSHVYLNFESDKKLHALFVDSLEPDRILRNLSLYLERTIDPNTDLILFDEIQECDNALNSLKYFSESETRYHVIAAGSLLGVKHSKKGFPVGQVEFLDVHPLSFSEFLEMMGHHQLVAYIASLKKPEPIADAIHMKLIEKAREYMWLGGMPEVVARYAKEPHQFVNARSIQRQIIRTYQLDFAKYAPADQVAKIGEIFAQIPVQIAKENKKFKISAISKNARLREYSTALQWLVDSGIVHKISNINQIDVPLAAHADRSVFKLFMIDTGLLGAMLDVPVKSVLDQTELFTSYKGALTESYVAQQMIANGFKEIYYWTGPADAEVDFVLQEQNGVYPLEVKAGINVRSKSLLKFGEQYSLEFLSRCTAHNLRQDGHILNYPLYCVDHFPKWTATLSGSN